MANQTSLYHGINLGILIRDHKLVSSIKEKYWDYFTDYEKIKLDKILNQQKPLTVYQQELMKSFKSRAVNRIAQGWRAV